MKKRKSNPLVMFGVIFAAIGLAFFITGVSVLSLGIYNSRGVKVPAIITDIKSYTDSYEDTSYDVFVEYEYEGECYTNVEINYYSSFMRVGKSIDVKIDPDNPGEVKSTAFFIAFGGIFGGVGLIFAIIGIYNLIKLKNRKALIKSLLEGGNYIYAKFDKVVTSGVYINNRPTYLILCIYKNPEDGTIYSFKSDHLSFDPTSMISNENIKVYIEGSDFSKNYIDISEFEDKYIEC